MSAHLVHKHDMSQWKQWNEEYSYPGHIYRSDILCIKHAYILFDWEASIMNTGFSNDYMTMVNVYARHNIFSHKIV